MVFLAQHVGETPVPGPRIAKETRIPSRYLSTILSSLVRAGVLEASPGLRGGFRLARRPQDIPLIDVLVLFEGSMGNLEACPFGNDMCSELSPCAGHAQWKKLKEAYVQFLRETTVQDVSNREESHHVAVSQERNHP
jgi:Rrf2 family protein